MKMSGSHKTRWWREMDSNFRFRARNAALRSRPSSRSLSRWRKFRKRLALSPGGDGAGWMVLKRPRDSLLGRDGSGGRFRRWALRHASSKIPSCVLSRAAASGDVNNLVISIPIVLASTRIRKSGFQRRVVRTLFRVGRELATHEIAPGWHPETPGAEWRSRSGAVAANGDIRERLALACGFGKSS